MSTATPASTGPVDRPGAQALPPDEMRCVAHLSDGSGERCSKWRVKGATVCISHGAGSPKVRQAARQRLADLVDPALSLLAQSLERELKANDGRVTVAVVRLAEAVLDRGGHPRRQVVEVEDEARELVALQGQRIAAALLTFGAELGHDVRSPEVREAARHALEVASGEELPPLPRLRHAQVERRLLAAPELEDEEDGEEDEEEAAAVEEPDEVLVP